MLLPVNMVIHMINFKTTQKCCYIGYIVQAVSINFLPLLFVMFQNMYNLSYTLIGTLVFVNFITQLLVDIVSVFYLDKIGYRVSAVASQFFCTAGFFLLTILPEIMPPYLGLCIGVILYSIGAGLIEVVINPIIAGLPEECEGSFVLTHSFYCWGQLGVVLATTVALKIFGEGSWKLISCFWGVIPFINGLLFIKTPITPTAPSKKRRGVKSLFESRVFLAILILMICAGGSELAMAQWASTFAQKALGVDKMIGDLFGPCLFAFFMGIGRLIYGIYEKRLNFIKYSTVCCILCILCYALAAISENPFISLAGCAVCGFAISTLWPGVVELSSKVFSDGGGAMYSSIAIFGDVGCSAAPFITGIIASMKIWGESGLRIGLLSNMIYPLIFILTITRMSKMRCIISLSRNN